MSVVPPAPTRPVPLTKVSDQYRYASPPSLPPKVERPLTGRRSSRPWQSAYGSRDKCTSSSTPPLRALDERALRRMQVHKVKLEERFLEADVGPFSRESAEDGAIISKFLQFQSDETNVDSKAERQEAFDFEEARAPLRSLLGGRGAERLSHEVKELKAKCLRLERERNKLQEKVTEKDERLKQLEDDLKRMRQDPHTLHPAVQRLRKMGLNTPALAELGERWAGYVFGRTSMAMETGNFAFRSVFTTHAHNGVLTEDSFKSVIRQFEPSIKSDQLTRLWFFADSDGSGQLDLFEFMRMFGCNANGDMSDEYFEVVIMYVYKKFHARGGIRRVYASADKDQDSCLSPEEWSQFLTSTKLGLSRQEMNLTKQEMHQVFQRMNTSNSGLLTVAEFETALENAASKCVVSEKWVRDTFKAAAVAIQEEGMNLRNILPTTLCTKDFRDIMKRFVPQLRASQLDRLWKYVLASSSEESGERQQATDQMKIDNEMFLRIAFGHALGLQEVVENSGETKLGAGKELHDKSVGSSYGPPVTGTGREVLEQLAMLLRKHTGEVPLESCFECLDPFLTPEHFHTQLAVKFGLQYSSNQTKQIFSLIDVDRDGKITRYEFLSLFRKLVMHTKDDEDSSSSSATGDEGTHMQVNKLLNRVWTLESELQQLRTHLGRIGVSNVYGGEATATVPEKQFQMLAAAHNKLLQQRHDPSPHTLVGIGRSPGYLATTMQDRRRSPSPSQFPLSAEHMNERRPDIVSGTRQRSPSQSPRHSGFNLSAPRMSELSPRQRGRSPTVMDRSPSQDRSPVSQSDVPASSEADERMQKLVDELTECKNESKQLIRDFDSRMQALLEENEALRHHLEVARETAVAAKAVSILESPNQGTIPEDILSVDEVAPNLKDGSLSNKNQMDRKPSLESATSETVPTSIASTSSKLSRSSTVPLRFPDSTKTSPSDLSKKVSVTAKENWSKWIGSIRQRRSSASSFTMPSAFSDTAPQKVFPEPIGPVRRALRRFAETTSRSLAGVPIQGLTEDLVGAVLEDRFRVEAILFVSLKVVVARAMDCLLNRQVSLRLLYDLQMAHRKSFSYEQCILAKLASVPHVPDVFHLSGVHAGIVYSAMELLQGKTLAIRFQEVQIGRNDGDYEDEITGLEAMEIADTLLKGVDQCHQQNIINLSIRPDTIWISPPLSAARVRILHWENAQGFNGQAVNPEFKLLLPGHRDEEAKDILQLVRGNQNLDISTSEFQSPRVIARGAYASNKLQGCKIDQPFPNLFVKDVGALYYMSTEQLYSLLASHQMEGMPRDKWEWAQEKVGSSVKLDGQSVYWWQKGNGLVQTAMPVPAVPLGRVFEVEVVKVMTMVRRHNSDLGFCIGLTPVPPNILGNALEKDRDKAAREAFFAGGDCAYYIRGERIPATNSSPESLLEESKYRIEFGGSEYSSLHINEGLRRGDKVCLLAEWSGDLVLYINGERVGCCPRALRPGDAVRPLFGLVDLYAHSNTDEHNVRAVSLVPETEILNNPVGGEKATEKAAELRTIDEMVQSSVETPLAPAADVYACALVLLQCFRGGREVTLSPAYELFQVAMSVWINEKCPAIQGEYYLLSAIRDLLGERETNLGDIGSARVRCVLARALKRSRYSRLCSCWDFGMMLNETTGWQEMTSEFLASHIEAVDQAERRYAAELHLLMSRGASAISKNSKGHWSPRTIRRFTTESVVTKKTEDTEDSEDSEIPSFKLDSSRRSKASVITEASDDSPEMQLRTKQVMQPVIAIWDLRPFSLGHSHLTRVVQVLTKWNRREAIRLVAVSRFAEHLPEQLQANFVACFNSNSLATAQVAVSSGKTMRSQKKPLSGFRSEITLKALGLNGANLVCEDAPLLVLEDVVLPAEELPPDRFSLRELVRHHLLWLVVQFVAILDLEPGPEQFQDAQTTRVGDNHAWVNELALAVSRSSVLRHLNLRSSNLGDHGGWVLANAVRTCSNLEWLNLSDNDLGAKAAAAMVTAAESGKKIAYLDLSRNSIGDKGARDLAIPLAHGGSLRELRLGQNQIGPEGGEALSESLLTNTYLTDLHLGYNNITLPSVLGLLRVTCAASALRLLVLDHNAPWPPFEGNEDLVQSVVNCLGYSGDARDAVGKVSHLKALSLRHCNIRSNSAQKLFEALAHNRSMEQLNMSWNAIRQVGPLEIVRVLAESRSACRLVELDLRDNQLGTQNALGNAFAEVFKKSSQGFVSTNTKLRCLNLGNNEITPKETRLLAEALPAFVALEDLYLYHNPEIGVQGAQAIAKLLNAKDTGMHRLHRLVVSVCGLGDAGIRAIANAVRGNEQLKEIDVSGNGVTDISMHAVAEVITHNMILETFNLGLNCIGSSGLQQLIDAATSRQHDLKDSAEKLTVDVSAQAEPSDLDLGCVSDEALAMFVGIS